MKLSFFVSLLTMSSTALNLSKMTSPADEFNEFAQVESFSAGHCATVPLRIKNEAADFNESAVHWKARTDPVKQLIKAKAKTAAVADFNDPFFGHSKKELYFTGPNSKVTVADKKWYDALEWQRISDLFIDPVLFGANGITADAIQGQISNCWVISALSAVAAWSPRTIDNAFLTKSTGQ